MLPCCCLTLYENIVCSVSLYLFIFFLRMLSLWQLCEPLEWVIVQYGFWVCYWEKQRIYLIWFLSFRERCIEWIFLRTQMPSITLRGYAPNKQTDRSLQMIYVWVFVYVRPRVHVSLYVSVFFKICKSHLCVCVYLSSSWQMPSTAQLGPSHRRGHRDPRFSLGPLRLL